MKVTVETLRAKKAYQPAIDDFARVFPDGVDIDDYDPWAQTIVIGTLGKWWGQAVYNRIIPAWSMRYADLHYANLSGADVSGADVSGANLSCANLSYANLSYANLSCANLSDAIGYNPGQ